MATAKSVTAAALSQLGVCRWCCARFDTVDSEETTPEDDLTVETESPCVLCENLLPELHDDAYLRELASAVGGPGYDSPRLNFSINLPAAFDAHLRSLTMAHSSSAGVTIQENVPLKNAVREALRHQLMPLLPQYTWGGGHEFLVHLTWETAHSLQFYDRLSKVRHNFRRPKAQKRGVIRPWTTKDIDSLLERIDMSTYTRHMPCPPKAP
ncbi:uncharacterized protein MONBRDRAFT_33226, partial [Monosiga brevicollis MX1]